MAEVAGFLRGRSHGRGPIRQPLFVPSVSSRVEEVNLTYRNYTYFEICEMVVNIPSTSPTTLKQILFTQLKGG